MAAEAATETKLGLTLPGHILELSMVHAASGTWPQGSVHDSTQEVPFSMEPGADMKFGSSEQELAEGLPSMADTVSRPELEGSDS